MLKENRVKSSELFDCETHRRQKRVDVKIKKKIHKLEVLRYFVGENITSASLDVQYQRHMQAQIIRDRNIGRLIEASIESSTKSSEASRLCMFKTETEN